ncbi:MAG: glycerol-3-phosphate 1-O-acyltransferase PlsY [Chloroflexota bacterium]
MIILKIAAILVFGYLLGSIPFGVIAAKLRGGVDVTKYGSGRTGVTNVLRTAGKRAAALAMIGDLGKGVLGVLLASMFWGETVVRVGQFQFDWQVAQVIAALAMMAGHNWSAFLKLHGGRGVAVFFGSWFAMSPLTALFGGEMLLVVVIVYRYMSLGSIVGAVAIWTLLAILTIFNYSPPIYLLYGLIAALLIYYQHRDNISRLLAGTERRIGEKAEQIGV